jgi:hypothetical protein
LVRWTRAQCNSPRPAFEDDGFQACPAGREAPVPLQPGGAGLVTEVTVILPRNRSRA